MATSWRKIINGRAVAAALTAIFAAAAALFAPFYQEAVNNKNSVYHSVGMRNGEETLRQQGQQFANQLRDDIYSDLCTLGTVYLSNCEDGVYTGSGTLYESMYDVLSSFEGVGFLSADNPALGSEERSMRGLDIDQSQYNITNIDSDYYWFYVSYGGEVLTNIADTENMQPREYESRLAKLTDEGYYYFRENNKIKYVTPHSEKGLGKTEVYYLTASDGKRVYTSEYIDSDKLLLGAANVDIFGTYTVCFSYFGDVSMNSYDYDEDIIPGEIYYNSEENTISVQFETYYEEEYDGYTSSAMAVQQVISADDPRFYRYIYLNGGVYDEVGNWVSYEDLPIYTLSSIPTSQLTVFMSPKVDIVRAATDFARQTRHDIRLYGTLTWVSLGAWGAAMVVFILLTALRPADKYRGDCPTIVTRFFKPDVCLISLGVAAFLTVVLMSISIYTPTVRYRVTAGVVVLLADILAAFSLGGIVRSMKLRRFTKQKLMITVIGEKTAPARRRIRQRLGRLPLIRDYMGAPLRVRHFIRTAIFTLPCMAVLIWTGSFEGLAAAVLLLMYLCRLRKNVRDIERLEGQIDAMLAENDGLGKAEPAVGETSPLYPLSEKLADISGKAEQAVADRVNSEKMKVELVTNVSHDLKTPLTSIISYIDLLSKTELSDEAADYVKILNRKADKLCDIVADVFSLAKAVSGVEIDMQEMDLAVLTRQVLADAEDKIAESGREIRTDISPEHAPITADGAKLYRVIQNLLDNALKYSMAGTRIYVALKENSGSYTLSIKNVSAYEVKFSAEEITERFTRGDESRTDGGSGLGLSIAKSFTQACGGSFKLDIDGDIFMAAATFASRNER